MNFQENDDMGHLRLGRKKKKRSFPKRKTGTSSTKVNKGFGSLHCIKNSLLFIMLLLGAAYLGIISAHYKFDRAKRKQNILSANTSN